VASLLEQLRIDLKTAMRAGDESRTGTLRMALAAIHNREIEKHAKGAALTEEDVADAMAREAKKRKEAIALYTQGGRKDLADAEAAELAILSVYLPPEAGDSEVREAVAAAVAAVKPAGEKDFGKVMGVAMKALKGKADAERVTRAVKEALGA
jgi:uncharacterized protein